jgi:hypothetical protein
VLGERGAEGWMGRKAKIEQRDIGGKQPGSSFRTEERLYRRGRCTMALQKHELGYTRGPHTHIKLE